MSAWPTCRRSMSTSVSCTRSSPPPASLGEEDEEGGVARGGGAVRGRRGGGARCRGRRACMVLNRLCLCTSVFFFFSSSSFRDRVGCTHPHSTAPRSLALRSALSDPAGRTQRCAPGDGGPRVRSFFLVWFWFGSPHTASLCRLPSPASQCTFEPCQRWQPCPRVGRRRPGAAKRVDPSRPRRGKKKKKRGGARALAGPAPRARAPRTVPGARASDGRARLGGGAGVDGRVAGGGMSVARLGV